MCFASKSCNLFSSSCVTLPSPKGRKIKVAAFVDQELSAQAAKFCDLSIKEPDFTKYANKKTAKKLAEDYDYFIAQANLMPKIAANFGRILGTRGKMPNPKLGCVVPPSTNLEPLIKKLNHTVRLQAKKGLNLQCVIGKQDQRDEEIIDNILTIALAMVILGHLRPFSVKERKYIKLIKVFVHTKNK